MRRDNSEFKTNFVSEAGTFKMNKDYFAFMELDDAACFIAADGIDSENEIKSAEIVAKSIFADFSEKPTISRMKIRKYINNANKILRQESRNISLKSSLIVVITDYSKIVWAVVGNARLYHFRKGRFNFKNKDQSVAQMLSDAGNIEEWEIDQHEEKNNLFNYMGRPNNFKPFISAKYKLNDGDVMLLCTSEFWGNVNTTEMVKALKDTKEPEEFVDNLEETLLGKQKMILNNYTIAAIFANKTFIENNKDKKALIKKIAMFMIPILIIVAMFVVYKVRDSKKQAAIRAELINHENNGDEFVKEGNYDKALKEYQDAEGCLNTLKVKDKKQEIDKKYKITQLINDGDKKFEEKKFDKAQENYKKAKKLADKEKDYDKKELNKKIAATEDYITIADLEKKADDKAENQDLKGAKELYEEAKSLADKNSFDDAKKELKSKMQETNSKVEEVDKKQKSLQGEDLEKQGDESYTAKDYAKALQSYEAAQTMYQQLNNLQGVLSIQTKIKDVQEKINPTIAPAPVQQQPAATSTTENNSGKTK